MSAPLGNQFWKMADPECLGRPLAFKTPKELWEQAKLYFEECDDNPLQRTEVTNSDKGIFHKTYSHKVPYTWEGLYVFLGITTLDNYKKREDFLGIYTHIGNIIRNQKYTGAATGLFNASIIARDLGLKEGLDHTSNGKHINDGFDYSKLSKAALEEIAGIESDKG